MLHDGRSSACSYALVSAKYDGSPPADLPPPPPDEPPLATTV